MSRSHSGDAYSLLERSFHEGPLLRSHKVLPHKKHNGMIFPAAAPVRYSSFADDESASQPSLPRTSPLPSPNVITRQSSGMPPTPPSNSYDDAQQAALSPPNFQTAGGLTPSMARKSAINTPTDRRGLPTPDTTPPASLNVPQQPSPSLYPSSRAESFTTAREDQWSSDGEGNQARKQGTGHEQDAARMFFEAARSMKLGRVGLAMESKLRDNDAMTMKEHSTKLEAMSKANVESADVKEPDSLRDVALGITDGILDEIPNREWDTNLMRNVTMRRRKPLRLLAERALLTQDLPSVSTTQKDPARRHRIENAEHEPQTPVTEKFSEEIGWPSGANKILNYSHMRDEDSKRLSMLSTTSTVVEAMIVVTPQQQHPRRTLRHTGKNLALRGQTSSWLDGSSSPHSNRTPFSSDDVPQHRLTHKRASIPDRRSRDSSGSDTTASAVSSVPSEPNKHRLRHVTRRDVTPRYTYRSGDEANSNPDQLLAGAGRGSEGEAFLYTPPSASAGGPLSSPSYRRNASSPSSLDSHSPPRPPRRLTDGNGNLVARDLAYRRFQLEQEQQGTDTTLVPTTGEFEQSFTRARPFPETKEHEWFNIGQERPVAHVTNHRTRSSLDRIPVEELPRVSFDRSTTRTEEHPRASLDRSTVGAGEHAMARHLYAQVTPFSQFSQASDMPDALEVSEATAVSIHPHNNNSLLVVQQVARSNSISGRQMLDGPPMQPTLTIEPCTPPQRFVEPVSVDSPLKNPRKPPVPPAFKVIPPTPSETDEHDRQLDEPFPEPESPARPVRRLSLVQRARRYSDSFIQPLFSRSASLRRSANGGSQRRAPSVSEQQDRNLHPFWRPRGFWDDLSDSEDDEFFSQDARDDDRLPRGGDTSEVVELQRRDSRLRRAGRRVGEGFKGSGGFMIGNSLGVERQPTNSRRHHISLPLSLASRHGEDSYEGRANMKRSSSNDHGKVVKRRSANSLRESVAASERSIRRSGRTWKRVRGLSSLGASVQYIRLRGVADKLREHRQEKRREEIRRSIGPRFMVEGAKVA